MPNYWLMKSEPGDYSIDDLKRDKSTPWTGVRNYQARNFMRDTMKVGDKVLFYHSNANPPHVAGIARISRSAHPDLTALDPRSKYFDAKAAKDRNVWCHVDVAFVKKFKKPVPLDALRAESALRDLLVLKRGMRLSIQPVEAGQFKCIEKLGRG